MKPKKLMTTLIKKLDKLLKEIAILTPLQKYYES